MASSSPLATSSSASSSSVSLSSSSTSQNEWTEDEALDAYRSTYNQSGPILRLLQVLLVQFNRKNASKHSKLTSSRESSSSGSDSRGGGGGIYPYSAGSFMLLYHILRGILYIPHTMPGAEHSFHLLNSLWPDLSTLNSNSSSSNNNNSEYVNVRDNDSYIRSKLSSMLDICLRILSRPQRTDPSADKG